MKIAVQGLWHLGSVTAACLAARGHRVIGFDRDAKVVAGLTAGSPPVFEPGLEALTRESLDSGKLTFSCDERQAFDGIEVLWVTYDTPVDEDDQADVGFVFGEVERSLPNLPANTVVLISSQMPVGSIRKLEAIAAARFPDHGLVFA